VTSAWPLLFLASLGVDWPALPGNVRLPELLFVPALIAVVATHGRTLRFHPLDSAVIAYIAASAIGLVASSDRTSSLVELARHGYLAMVYALVALAVVRGFRRTVLIGLASMGAVPAAVGLGFALLFLIQPVTVPAAGEVMKLPYAGEVLRLRAFTFSPTMFASVLIVALPFAVTAWIDASDVRAHRLAAAAFVVMTVALVMTFSHAWVGAALAVTVASWPMIKPHRMLRVASVLVVVLLAVAFNASLAASVRAVSLGDDTVTDATDYPYGVDHGTAQIGPLKIDYAVMSYLRTKQLAAEAFVEHPLTGVGLDRFHDVTRAAYLDGRLTPGYREIDPHSSLLGRFAETGFAGGLTLVVLWVLTFVTARPLVRPDAADPWLARAALAGFAGLLLAGINVDIMNFRFLWAGVGVLRGLADGNA
jgi:hypothetical protein